MTNSSPLCKCLSLVVAILCTATLSVVSPSWAQEPPITDETAVESATRVHQYVETGKDGDEHAHIEIQTNNGSFIVVTGDHDADTVSKRKLSPGEQIEADHLKKEHLELLKEQKTIAKRLRDLEAMLMKLGVPVKRVNSVTVGFRTGKPVYNYTVVNALRRFDEAVNLPIRVTTQGRVTRTSRSPSLQPESVARKTRVKKRTEDESSFENRLKRLEQMMEKLLDAKEKRAGDGDELESR